MKKTDLVWQENLTNLKESLIQKQKRLILITGPRCVGGQTVIDRLLAFSHLNLRQPLITTTQPKMTVEKYIGVPKEWFVKSELLLYWRKETKHQTGVGFLELKSILDANLNPIIRVPFNYSLLQTIERAKLPHVTVILSPTVKMDNTDDYNLATDALYQRAGSQTRNPRTWGKIASDGADKLWDWRKMFIKAPYRKVPNLTGQLDRTIQQIVELWGNHKLWQGILQIPCPHNLLLRAFDIPTLSCYSTNTGNTSKIRT